MFCSTFPPKVSKYLIDVGRIESTLFAFPAFVGIFLTDQLYCLFHSNSLNFRRSAGWTWYIAEPVCARRRLGRGSGSSTPPSARVCGSRSASGESDRADRRPGIGSLAAVRDPFHCDVVVLTLLCFPSSLHSFNPIWLHSPGTKGFGQ